ncbi:MAG: MATE family efflux transporter, partial [Clostridia bacterium]
LSSTFQALGNGVYSLILSFCRQILLILPVAWAMARFVGVGGVWWAFPIAEVFSLTMAVMMFRKIYGQKLKYLEAQ